MRAAAVVSLLWLAEALSSAGGTAPRTVEGRSRRGQHVRVAFALCPVGVALMHGLGDFAPVPNLAEVEQPNFGQICQERWCETDRGRGKPKIAPCHHSWSPRGRRSSRTLIYQRSVQPPQSWPSTRSVSSDPCRSATTLQGNSGQISANSVRSAEPRPLSVKFRLESTNCFGRNWSKSGKYLTKVGQDKPNFDQSWMMPAWFGHDCADFHQISTRIRWSSANLGPVCKTWARYDRNREHLADCRIWPTSGLVQPTSPRARFAQNGGVKSTSIVLSRRLPHAIVEVRNAHLLSCITLSISRGVPPDIPDR